MESSSRSTRLSPSCPPSVAATRLATGMKRSEEHTSELQSHLNLVCRLLLEKKKHLHVRPRDNRICRLCVECVSPPDLAHNSAVFSAFSPPATALLPAPLVRSPLHGASQPPL